MDDWNLAALDAVHDNLASADRVVAVVGEEEEISAIHGWLHAPTVIVEQEVSNCEFLSVI